PRSRRNSKNSAGAVGLGPWITLGMVNHQNTRNTEKVNDCSWKGSTGSIGYHSTRRSSLSSQSLYYFGNQRLGVGEELLLPGLQVGPGLQVFTQGVQGREEAGETDVALAGLAAGDLATDRGDEGGLAQRLAYLRLADRRPALRQRVQHTHDGVCHAAPLE